MSRFNTKLKNLHNIASLELGGHVPLFRKFHYYCIFILEFCYTSYIYKRVMLEIQLILQPNAYKLTWHLIWK